MDSLKRLLLTAREDSAKVNLYVSLLGIYTVYKPTEGIFYKDTALRLALKVNNKSGIARINDKIGRVYWAMGKFSDAYQYHFTALDLYKEIQDIPARNYVLVEIGQDYLNDTRFEEAAVYLNQALKLSMETGDKLNVFRTYDKLIALYENTGNFVEASKATYANIKVCEELGDKPLLLYAECSLADNLQRQGNYEEALKHFARGLQLSKELNSGIDLTGIYKSVGEIYVAKGNYGEAEKAYREGLQVANSMENPIGILTYLYRGLGNMYRMSHRYPQALENLLKSAEELRILASNHALANVYAEIGVVYTQMYDYRKARIYFDSSMALCKKLNTKINFESYYSGLHLLDSATGRWKDAYQHYKQYITIKDSTLNEEVLGKMVTAQIQFENDKKEVAIQSELEKKQILAQQEIRRQRTIRNMAFAVLGFMFLFAIVVFYQRNKIAKEKRKSDAVLKENEVLLKEIHHRVKNNLEVVSSLLALQSNQINDPNIKEAMLAGQNRVQSIGIVHQKLYKGRNFKAVEMKEYFINLSESIIESFGAEKKVSVEYPMEPLEVHIDIAVPLGLIVNELLTNTLKYAFPDNLDGKISIALEKSGEGYLFLSVSDNGIGKSGPIQGTGFGGQLIALLTQQLNGSMTEEVVNGTHINFRFKPAKASS